MAVVSLRSESYKKTKKVAKNITNNSLYSVVDEIVGYLIKDRASVVIEIDKGNILQSEIDNSIYDYIKKNNLYVEGVQAIDTIMKEVKFNLWGYGAINKYIKDRSVSDVSIKDVNDTWIKINGKRHEIDLPFKSKKSIENFCHRISLKTGGNLSQRNALIITGDSTEDFYLRNNIAIAPVTDTPYTLIRKIPKWTIKPTMTDLYNKNMFNDEVGEYIRIGFEVGLNTCVCGPGAGGKSTLMNAGIEEIPEYESKLGIQEVKELSSGKKNWNWLTVVKATGESDVEYTLQEYAQQGLTMDIDRYIIGESKAEESMALFDGSYTGHKILYGVHAPSALQAIDKTVFNMKKGNTSYTDDKLKELLQTLDTIYFLDKYKVCEIVEVEGWDKEKKDLKLRTIFRFNTEYDDGVDLYGSWEKINDSCDKVKQKISIKKGINR